MDEIDCLIRVAFLGGTAGYADSLIGGVGRGVGQECP